MQFGLKETVIAKMNALFNKSKNVEQVIIYGSRAKGNYKNGSDIDLTILGENMEYAELSKLEEQIDDLLLPYMIDLSILKKIENPDLLDHIRRVGQVFYQRQTETTE